MPSKEQKKFAKKKEREREVRQKILARRAEIRKQGQEERDEFKKMKRIKKLKRDLGGLNVWADEVFMKMSDKAISQLEHNAKILKVLEEEYEKEHSKKRELNEKLEGEGHQTLEAKIKAMHQKLVDDQKAAGAEIIAEELRLAGENAPSIFENANIGFASTGADCKVMPSKPKKDVAEVSVIRAPDADLKEENSEQS